MKKQKLLLILPLFTLFIAFVFGIASYRTQIPTEAATLAENKSQLGILKDKYATATAKTKQVRADLEKTRGEIKTNQQKKDDLDAEIVALTEQIKTAEFLLAEYQTAIDTKNAEKEALEKTKQEQTETLGAMMKTSYMYGEESYIDLILGSTDIGDFLQRLDFISYHMRYSSTLISDMETTAKQLEEVTGNLETTYTAMATLQTELETAKAELEPKLAEVEALIITLQSDEAYLAETLQKEEEDTAILEEDIEALEKTIAEEEAKKKKEEEERKKREEASKKPAPNKDTTPQSPTGSNPAGDGKIIWPLKGYRPMTSSYGYRRDPITGRTAFHNGLDIAAPHGTNIYAAESGTVIRASRYDTYGECVIIDHGGGMITLYAHCSGYNVVVGQKVTQGDVIAFVGSTGRSTGNHLHFVVRINGVYKDPNDYLPAR